MKQQNLKKPQVCQLKAYEQRCTQVNTEKKTSSKITARSSITDSSYTYMQAATEGPIEQTKLGSENK